MVAHFLSNPTSSLTPLCPRAISAATRIRSPAQKDGKPYHTYNFTYTQIEDKYPLNFPTDNIDDINYNHIGGSYIGGINDKYLPYFGKHTSPLIDVMIDKNDVTGQIMTGASIYFSGYVVDSDGLVISKNLTQYSAGWTETFSYSATSWQGIP